MTPREQLTRLQVAVDQIAAVIQAGTAGHGDLSVALDLIHHAENAIEEAADAKG